MPNFDSIFSSSTERPIQYKDKQLFRADYIPFKDGDELQIIFEKTNSEWTQGIGLAVFGYFEINGNRYKERIFLWENTSPKEINIKIYEENSKRKQPKSLPIKGLIAVKNIWNPGNGSADSWCGGAAMIIQEIPNGRRYYCNDGHPDDNFDDIIFSVRKIGS